MKKCGEECGVSRMKWIWEEFSDVMDFYGELLWNVEELGDEFVEGWDVVLNELGDLQIYGVDWEELD